MRDTYAKELGKLPYDHMVELERPEARSLMDHLEASGYDYEDLIIAIDMAQGAPKEERYIVIYVKEDH